MNPLKVLFPAAFVVSALGGCAQFSPADADRVVITERPGYYSESLVTGSSFDDHDHWKWKDRDDRKHRDDRDDRKHDRHEDTASNDDGNRRDRRDQDRRSDDQDRKKKDDDDSSKKKDDDSSRKSEREAPSGGRAHTNVVFTHASDGSRGPAKKDDSDKNDKSDKKDNDDKDDKKSKKD
jgi:hypothetical protein